MQVQLRSADSERRWLNQSKARSTPIIIRSPVRTFIRSNHSPTIAQWSMLDPILLLLFSP